LAFPEMPFRKLPKTFVGVWIGIQGVRKNFGLPPGMGGSLGN